MIQYSLLHLLHWFNVNQRLRHILLHQQKINFVTIPTYHLAYCMDTTVLEECITYTDTSFLTEINHFPIIFNSSHYSKVTCYIISFLITHPNIQVAQHNYSETSKPPIIQKPKHHSDCPREFRSATPLSDDSFPTVTLFLNLLQNLNALSFTFPFSMLLTSAHTHFPLHTTLVIFTTSFNLCLLHAQQTNQIYPF